MYKIDNFNKELIVERYVDDIVGRLNFIEVKEKLKDCILQQKYNLSNEDLEFEIMRHDPGLLADIYFEEVLEGV